MGRWVGNKALSVESRTRSVMPGLVPGIHVVRQSRGSNIGDGRSCNGSDDTFNGRVRLDVDGRDKPGHDGASSVTTPNKLDRDAERLG
jgi:hypothetical protein